jgi:hypothetical protein
VDRAKSEERDKFMNRTLLRLVREGGEAVDRLDRARIRSSTQR